jgi:hypothetical protein
MGDTFECRPSAFGAQPRNARPQPAVFMRTVPLAILGAPFAAWALHGCLLVLGLPAAPAAVIAMAWAVLWLAIVHLGPSAKLFRRRLGAGDRGIPGGRGIWTGAVLGSFFLPIPVYGFSVAFEWLDIASAALTLPLFAMLSLPLPAAFWWMLLRPSTDREGEIIHPLGWRRFTPHAPSGVIPPRKGESSSR